MLHRTTEKQQEQNRKSKCTL